MKITVGDKSFLLLFNCRNSLNRNFYCFLEFGPTVCVENLPLLEHYSRLGMLVDFFYVSRTGVIFCYGSFFTAVIRTI